MTKASSAASTGWETYRGILNAPENAITHIVASVRFRVYNPGLVTSIVLFLPFTIWALWTAVAPGRSGVVVALILLLGVLLHVPVAMVFVIPYLKGRRAHAH